jgi:hypothetical protein
MGHCRADRSARAEPASNALVRKAARETHEEAAQSWIRARSTPSAGHLRTTRKVVKMAHALRGIRWFMSRNIVRSHLFVLRGSQRKSSASTKTGT